MTISDRIFEKLQEKGMTQKEFASLTGIPESTVSDWRKKKTNPTADKILVICKALDVTPEWILSGIDADGGRSKPLDYFIVEKNSDQGRLIDAFNNMQGRDKTYLLGYIEAFKNMQNNRD
ncbi:MULTISPECIES: helix-turn-helix domain-containing protein [Pseudobutyrivibrio]|uniref:Transcriptional regulator, contains XRE-family HTH domain n=1 Tax=Pseudobutyrivibrio xylanivorans TaxID=185007 RepID=A0A1G5RTS9_PSEXY|nr:MULTISPECIES: helix-turn-helix transcriptional regulator [Pseudobutyrivibrio]MDC7279590.1 helix-turn-helix domain-containing protein [Butyrivibrio fibrisolvens]SCZ77494.1 Transcriptional regulator, contains XRE-family HTH domain [Pseudobutyrivibrio xylanivorans]